MKHVFIRSLFPTEIDELPLTRNLFFVSCFLFSLSIISIIQIFPKWFRCVQSHSRHLCPFRSASAWKGRAKTSPTGPWSVSTEALTRQKNIVSTSRVTSESAADTSSSRRCPAIPIICSCLTSRCMRKLRSTRHESEEKRSRDKEETNLKDKGEG